MSCTRLVVSDCPVPFLPDAGRDYLGVDTSTLLLTLTVFIMSSPPGVMHTPNLLQPVVVLFKDAWSSKSHQVLVLRIVRVFMLESNLIVHYRGMVCQWLEHAGGREFESHWCRFETWAISSTPLCQCLSEDTLKAVGTFYLVSIPGEVKDPSHRLNV